LEFKNLKIKDELDIIANEIKLKSFLKDYLENGSFPAGKYLSFIFCKEIFF